MSHVVAGSTWGWKLMQDCSVAAAADVQQVVPGAALDSCLPRALGATSKYTNKQAYHQAVLVTPACLLVIREPGKPGQAAHVTA